MYDPNNICFVCLNNQHNLNTLFHKGIEYDIFIQVKYVLPELVFSDLANPLYICSPCHADLRLFHVFKKKCIENYSRLTQYTQMCNTKEKQTEITFVQVEKPQIDDALRIKKEPEDPLFLSSEEQISEPQININSHEQFIEEENISVNKQIDGIENIDIKEEPLEYDGSEIQDLQHEFVKCEPESDNIEEPGPSLVSENNTSKNTNASDITLNDYYPCSLCTTIFLKQSYLDKHMKKHLGIKDVFQCSICRRKLSTESTLISHMNLHKGTMIKNVECSICEKKFLQKSHLRLHMKIHLGIKDHECTICKKKFAQICHLKQHMNLHLGIKNFKCSICGKAFAQNSHLKSHIKTHSGNKNYRCPCCNKIFYQNSQLMAHMSVHF